MTTTAFEPLLQDDRNTIKELWIKKLHILSVKGRKDFRMWSYYKTLDWWLITLVIFFPFYFIIYIYILSLYKIGRRYDHIVIIIKHDQFKRDHNYLYISVYWAAYTHAAYAGRWCSDVSSVHTHTPSTCARLWPEATPSSSEGTEPWKYLRIMDPWSAAGYLTHFCWAT